MRHPPPHRSSLSALLVPLFVAGVAGVVLACRETPGEPVATVRLGPAFEEVGNSPPEALGGLDLFTYCQSLGYDGFALTKPRFGHNAAYNNWRCQTASGEVHPFSFEQACKFQYGLEAVQAHPTDPDDAFTWVCYTVGNPPGDGLHGAIVFHSTRAGSFDIFVMNADGSGVTQLTNTADNDVDPFWSPNGQRIAFNRFAGGPSEIFVMNADGSGLTHVASNGFAKTWSPDGKQIAFVSNRTGSDEVFVMNADGSGLVQLTDNPAVDDPTAWSPDGRQILFRSNRDGNSELYVMNADGTGVTRLTNNPASDEGDHAGWSPDGKQIVFSSDRDGGRLHVFVMNADGTGVTQLTFGDFTDDDPVWSPNGKHIAFQSTRDGDEEVFVMNADGSDQTQVTFNEGIFDAVPGWRSQPLQ